MNASDIRNMTVEEIEQQLEDAQEEIWRLRFRAATEELQNPVLLRERRRDIARLKTVLAEHRKGIRTLGHQPTGEGEGS